MGRQSAGKWIRNLILGKKSSSKSNSSKNQDILKASTNKDVVMVVVSSTSEAPMSHPILTTAPPSSSAKAITKGTTPENGVVNGSSNEKVVIIASEDGKANAETQDAVANVGSVEKINLTDAAIIAQAALRGYQARRKFEMLKGFIPLQALIRGNLARKEAVSALYCVNGIVKVQALSRGYRVRHSAIGLQVQKTFKVFYQVLGGVASPKAEKISDSVFVQKLLASSPAVLSYRQLNYEWLERWTRSRFWAPVTELKKSDESVCDEKNVLGQTVECDEEKAKRNAKKKESGMALHSSAKENEKRKHHMTRKSSDHATTSSDVKKLEVSKSKESDIENHSNNFQRRASLPANYFKNESSENTSTTPARVPSYMAPTESAKAKLRGQDYSPRFERNGINSRRLSLSCSLNGKLGLVSPRSARFGTIASSKGMAKKADNRSLSTSRDWSGKKS
ncbi:IQ-domain, variant 2 [Stylosanthes scabra]|uniref:IQ-domain, variant 2 n=1 Tax=Stylosanthes scabra TaxID=79078 RepID=A0ABU6WSH3_9FABA|nr:IQ-domain, variant 2 [Stylosanthes scabra]